MGEQLADVTGGCLCGKVKYKAKIDGGTGACHCGTCRKWSSGPYMATPTQGNVEFQGQENIANYASSQWAERGFCKHCGSNLYYHLLPRPEAPDGQYMVSTGTLDDQSTLKFDHEVYVDGAPGWYKFDKESERKRMTEADILAMYGPDPEHNE